MDILFQIVTMIIPKAGIQLGGIPLTLNLLLFAIVILKNPNQTLLSIQQIPRMGICYAIVLFFGSVTFLLGIGKVDSFILSAILVVTLSPLAMVSTMHTDAALMGKVTAISLITVNIYALLQYAFSVTALAIPGLTYTYGQDLTQKTIGLDAAGYATKIPSTYQNGAYLGIFCVLGFCIMLVWRADAALWRFTRIIAMISSVGGLAVCGSRSIVFPFTVFICLILIEKVRTWPRRLVITYSIELIALVAVIISYFLIFQSDIINSFISRNITTTLNNPTFSGRTIQWSTAWQNIQELSFPELLQVLFTGNSTAFNVGGGEGLPRYICQMGIPSAIAFWGMFIVAIRFFWRTKKLRPISLGLVCVAIAFCTDKSFDYPPTVMEAFLTIGIGYSFSKEQSWGKDPTFLPA